MLETVWEKTGEQLADAFEDGAVAAKKAVRRVGNAAEDLVNDTGRTIRRHPVASAATICAVAFASGMLVGRAMNRH